MAEELLFAGNSVGDVLRAQLKRLSELVASLDADLVLATPEEDLLDRVEDQFHVPCPELRLDERYSPGAQDVQIDVSGDFRRATFGRDPIALLALVSTFTCRSTASATSSSCGRIPSA